MGGSSELNRPAVVSRRAVVGGAVATAAALAAGCSPVNQSPSGGRSDQPHKGPVHLSFWKPPGLDPKPENAFYNNMASAWSKGHHHDTVKHLIVPWDDALTKFTAAFSGGTAPDVSYLILQWLHEFSSSGALTALDEVDPHLDLKGFNGSALSSARGTDKKLYGMPYYSSRFVLGLNEEVWQKAGSPALPTTYEELSTFAKQLTRDTSGRRPGQAGFDRNHIATYGMSWPGDFATQTNYVWNYLWAYGADEVSKDAKSVGFDNPGGRQALTLLRDLQTSGAATPITLYADPNKWGELIYTGRVGVQWMAPPVPGSFKQFPHTTLKVLDIPKGPAGQFVVGGVGYLCISSKTKYPQTALDFINFLTEDRNVSAYLKKSLLFPVRNTIGADIYSSISDPKVKDFLTASLPQGKYMRLTRPLPYNAEQYLIGEINNYVSGQKSLDGMINDANKQIARMAKNAGL